jgi:hypothetical protein
MQLFDALFELKNFFSTSFDVCQRLLGYFRLDQDLVKRIKA